MRRMRDGHFWLTEQEWRELGREMRGENDGSWILQGHFRPDEDDCVAITVNGVSSLIIFVTRLAEVMFPSFSEVQTTLEDVRYVADLVCQSTARDDTVHPTYYLPRVHVERKGEPR